MQDIIITEYDKYKVKPGDSLFTIAKDFNTTVQFLTDINVLTNNTLYPNQILLVPKSNKKDIIFKEYKTVKNDTINSIATKFMTTPMLIGMYNDFANMVLEEKQVVKIPITVNEYKVKENDTFRSIEQKLNKNILDILELNKESLLKPGIIIKF